MAETACPRCGANVGSASECPACGVIVARARARAARPERVSKNAPPGGGSTRLVQLVVVAVFLGGAAYASVKWKQGSASKSAAAETPTASAPGMPAPAARSPARSAASIAAPSQQGSTDPGPVPVAPPLPSYGGWLTAAAGYDDAIRQQKESGSPILVYFFTDWCPYCKQFDSAIAPLADSKLLRVRVNPEAGGMDRQLADQMGVSGYPAVFVIARAGASPRRVEAGVARDAAPSPERFVASCKSTIVDELWRSGAQAAGPATPDLDRALQFDPTHHQILAARSYVRFKSGYRAASYEDAQRACALGNAEACKSVRG